MILQHPRQLPDRLTRLIERVTVAYVLGELSGDGLRVQIDSLAQTCDACLDWAELDTHGEVSEAVADTLRDAAIGRHPGDTDADLLDDLDRLAQALARLEEWFVKHESK